MNWDQGSLFLPEPDDNEGKAYNINKAWAQLSQEERQAAFLHYHQAHPRVYAGIVSLSRAMKQRGIQHWGMQAAFEVLRFEWVMRYNRNDFKINNNYRSYYSRLIMNQESDLKDFYEIREQQ